MPKKLFLGYPPVLQVLITPWMSQLFLSKKSNFQENCVADKVVNFKDFSRPNKEIKYFSRTFQDDY